MTRNRWCTRPVFLPLMAILAVGVLFAGFVGAVAPVDWEPVDWESAVNLSNTPGRSQQTTLARNPLTGDLFVAWADGAYGVQDEVVGRRWEKATQSWLPGLAVPPENLSQSPWADGGPALFFDQRGQGVLIWTRRYSASQGAPADRTEVLWRSWEGSGWSGEAVLMAADTYLPGTYGLIPVDADEGILWFITFDRSYRTTTFQDGSWSPVSPPVYLDFGDGVRPVLATALRDDQGLLHFAAFAKNSSQLGYDPWFYDAYYLTYDGANWTTPINLSWTDGVAHDVDLAFDDQGRLHFLWSDPDSVYSSESLKSAIWERVNGGGSWTPNAEVTAYNADQAIDGFSLATGVSGTLHLAWSEGLIVDNAHTGLDIYYQAGDGSTWGPEETVYASSALSRYPALSAGGGRVAAVWQEGATLERDVFFSQTALPPGPCVGIEQVQLSGALTATVGIPHILVASAAPLSATLPLTYTWQATDQPLQIHSGGLVDMAAFTWIATGTKAVTVTVQNCGGLASDSRNLWLGPRALFYLPVILQTRGR